MFARLSDIITTLGLGIVKESHISGVVALKIFSAAKENAKPDATVMTASRLTISSASSANKYL